MAKDASTAAQKWARNYGAAGTSATAGVQAVQEAPTAKAARRLDAYLAGVQDAVSSGRMQAGLARTSLSDWQQAYIAKAVPIMGSRATAALPKVQRVLQQLVPAMQGIASSLPPRGDFATNMQRAMQQAEAAHALKGKFRG